MRSPYENEGQWTSVRGVPRKETAEGEALRRYKRVSRGLNHVILTAAHKAEQPKVLRRKDYCTVPSFSAKAQKNLFGKGPATQPKREKFKPKRGRDTAWG